MQIVLEIPDRLGEKLQQFSDRLPELLERGLQQLISEQYCCRYQCFAKIASQFFEETAFLGCTS